MATTSSSVGSSSESSVGTTTTTTPLTTSTTNVTESTAANCSSSTISSSDSLGIVKTNDASSSSSSPCIKESSSASSSLSSVVECPTTGTVSSSAQEESGTMKKPITMTTSASREKVETTQTAQPSSSLSSSLSSSSSSLSSSLSPSSITSLLPPLSSSCGSSTSFPPSIPLTKPFHGTVSSVSKTEQETEKKPKVETNVTTTNPSLSSSSLVTKSGEEGKEDRNKGSNPRIGLEPIPGAASPKGIVSNVSTKNSSDTFVSSSDGSSSGLNQNRPLETLPSSTKEIGGGTTGLVMSTGDQQQQSQSGSKSQLESLPLANESNEATSTSSSPMKRVVTTTIGSNEPTTGSSESTTGSDGDQETVTDVSMHGPPAKRSKRSSSSTFKSTNGNGTEQGKESFVPTSSAGDPGIKDTTSLPGTSSLYSPSDSTTTSTAVMTSQSNVTLIQSSSTMNAGHEDITDSEDEDDEGKMMIDEDASSDRDTTTPVATTTTTILPPSLTIVSVPDTLAMAGTTLTNQPPPPLLGSIGAVDSTRSPPPVSSSGLFPTLQAAVHPRAVSKSPTLTGFHEQLPVASVLSNVSSGVSASENLLSSHQSKISTPVSSTGSPKVPPIRIVISKSLASSSPVPTVTSVQSTTDTVTTGPSKVSSSSNLNIDTISPSSSNNSHSPSNVSSSAGTTGEGTSFHAGGNKNQVSSSTLNVSKVPETTTASAKDEDESESEEEDGSENGSIGSGPTTGTTGIGGVGGKKGASGKSSDKPDGGHKESGNKTRSCKDGNSAGSEGRVTRSSQRVAAREKDGSHSSEKGTSGKRETSHRLRERRKDATADSSKDSPASHGGDHDGDSHHSLVSPTASSKDGSSELATESTSKAGPGRKRKGTARQGLRGKDSDRGTPEKSSKRVREIIKEDSNQGSNQGEDHEDNDSTSSSTSSTGGPASDQPVSTNGTVNTTMVTGTSGSDQGVVPSDNAGGSVPMSSMPPTGRESFQMPSYNSYQMYLNIRRQVEKRRKSLVPVTPKAPTGFKNYLLNRGNYLLHGKVAASSSLTNNGTLTNPIVPGGNNENYNSLGFISCNNNTTSYKLPMKLVPPPGLIPGTPLYHLFVQQENDRQKVRIQHTIEREKLRLSVEQEVLRVHGRAALAMANQSIPYSVCSILKDEEIYNILEPLDGDGGTGCTSPGHPAEDGGGKSNEYSKAFTSTLGQGFVDLATLTGAPPAPGSRMRYNGRILVQWLADVSDKWDKIKSETLKRQKRESESLVAIQKLDWEWKMKELKLCDFKSTPIIHSDLIPPVDVTDDFHLLPSN